MSSIQFSVLLVIFSVSTLVAESPLSQSYGAPPKSSLFDISSQLDLARGLQSFRNSLSSSGRGAVDDSTLLGANIRGPKVYRHVSLFVAPKDPDNEEPKVQVIRAGKSLPDKNYQIIFIKAPSRSGSQQTEVILPPQPQQKTLVYVLVKKPDTAMNNIKIRGPATTKSPPPEVYFIKYKGGSNAPIMQNSLASNSIGPVSSRYVMPSSSYGAPI